MPMSCKTLKIQIQLQNNIFKHASNINGHQVLFLHPLLTNVIIYSPITSLQGMQYERAEKLTVFTSWRKFESQFCESWPVLLMISHTAAAVAGTMHLWSKQSFPMFTMWNPSTSFSGATALHMALSLMCSDRDTFKKLITIANLNQINSACCFFYYIKGMTVTFLEKQHARIWIL